MQFNSALRRQISNQNRVSLGLPQSDLSADSRVVFIVRGRNDVVMRIRASTHPRHPVYVLAGGSRTSFNRGPIKLSAAQISAIRSGQEFHVSWNNWPYGNVVNYRDRFDGFAASMDACLTAQRR